MEVESHLQHLKESLEIIEESDRDNLCYGKPQKTEIIQKVIKNFNKLKEKFMGAGIDEI